jgi:hypothetical protein
MRLTEFPREVSVIFPGHVAAAYLASKATRADMRGALAASMFPDLIDKPVRWILRLTPNDRIPMHSLLGWMSSSALALALCGRRKAQGWWVGYGAHLLCDEINAHLNPGRIYFWWPFRRYAMHRGPTGLQSSLGDFRSASLVVEGLVAAIGSLVWALGRR